MEIMILGLGMQDPEGVEVVEVLTKFLLVLELPGRGTKVVNIIFLEAEAVEVVQVVLGCLAQVAVETEEMGKT